MSDVSLMNRTAGNEKRGNAATQPAALLTLGIAPVIFSGDCVQVGHLDPEEHGPIKDLRRVHGWSHAFRLDSRDGDDH